LPDLRQEIEPKLPARCIYRILAAGKTNAARFMANESTLRGAAEREDNEIGGRKVHDQSMMGTGANYFVS
jgi:hypothetical protein